MANNLKALRKKHDLTMAQLAERMGTTKNQLIKLESGERRLTEDWISRAAKALGEPMGAFINEEGDDADAKLATGRDVPVTAEYAGFDPLAFGRRLRLISEAGFPRLWERVGLSEAEWSLYLKGQQQANPGLYAMLADATGLADTFIKFGYPEALTLALLARRAQIRAV